MSDYEDENFELDETDEYWGVQRNFANILEAHRNNIKKIDI